MVSRVEKQTKQRESIMNMDTLAKQSIEAAMLITGTDGKDQETQEIAFKLACAMMAEEAAK
jgi:hypothetical protein